MGNRSNLTVLCFHYSQYLKDHRNTNNFHSKLGFTNTVKENQTFEVVQLKETLLQRVKGFGCLSRALVCIQIILNAY